MVYRIAEITGSVTKRHPAVMGGLMGCPDTRSGVRYAKGCETSLGKK
jgi:hypothetical protein